MTAADLFRRLQSAISSGTVHPDADVILSVSTPHVGTAERVPATAAGADPAAGVFVIEGERAWPPADDPPRTVVFRTPRLGTIPDGP